MSMKPLMLDAFSCAGIGADGYADQFEVICLDNDAKALAHNPHTSICGDAMVLLKDKGFLSQFQLVHASPPCQGFSATRELAKAQGKKSSKRTIDLLDPTREILSRVDIPWIIENVERSPVKHWPHVRLCGSSFGLKVQRHRLFAYSPGLKLTGTACNHKTFDIDPVSKKPRPWGVYYVMGDNIPSGGRTVTTIEQAHEVLGIPYPRAPWKYLCEGLPPVFTEHLANQVREQI